METTALGVVRGTATVVGVVPGKDLAVTAVDLVVAAGVDLVVAVVEADHGVAVAEEARRTASAPRRASDPFGRR